MASAQISQVDLQKALAALVGRNGSPLLPAPAPEPIKVKSILDLALPFLPTGWKTIVGLLGATGLFGLSQAGVVEPATTTDWVGIGITVFGALGGYGFVAKFQRAIDVAQQLLSYAPEIAATLQRLEDAAQKAQPADQK